MNDDIIYRASIDLSFADQLDYMRDVRAPIELHKQDIAAHHPRGEAFVEEVLGAVDGLTAAVEGMDAELRDADGALAQHTALGQQIGAYVARVIKVIELIETLGEEDEQAVRTLRTAYGLAGNRLSLTRRSHNERRLQQIVGAHPVYGPLLIKYSFSQQDLDAAKALWDALPQSGATLTKETAEKEQAVKDAHAAEAAAVSAVNKVFALASHHRAAHPKLHQALSSATRKHYAKLHP